MGPLAFTGIQLMFCLVELKLTVSVLLLKVVNFNFLFLSVENLRLEGDQQDLDLLRRSQSQELLGQLIILFFSFICAITVIGACSIFENDVVALFVSLEVNVFVFIRFFITALDIHLHGLFLRLWLSF